MEISGDVTVSPYTCHSCKICHISAQIYAIYKCVQDKTVFRYGYPATFQMFVQAGSILDQCILANHSLGFISACLHQQASTLCTAQLLMDLRRQTFKLKRFWGLDFCSVGGQVFKQFGRTWPHGNTADKRQNCQVWHHIAIFWGTHWRLRVQYISSKFIRFGEGRLP